MIRIIIVNFNSGPMLRRCVDSIREHVTTEHRITVIDNNSSDGSLKSIDGYDVDLIKNTDNLGFARANNQAARNSDGDILHFLNPDVVVNEAMDCAYVHAITRKAMPQIISTSLVDETGTLQCPRMLIPKVSNYIKAIFRPSKAYYWSIGASVILPRSVFQQLGGWTEDYFMYTEDLDLFYRAQCNNVQIKYLDTRLLHFGKACSSKVWTPQERANVMEQSFRKFFRKYGFQGEYFIVRCLLLLQQLVKRDPEFLLTFRAAFTKNNQNTAGPISDAYRP